MGDQLIKECVYAQSPHIISSCYTQSIAVNEGQVQIWPPDMSVTNFFTSQQQQTVPFTLFFTPLFTRIHLQVNQVLTTSHYLVNYALLKKLRIVYSMGT